MKKNYKRLIASSMLFSLLLTNNVKAEELGLVKVGRNSNPLSNRIVTCSTTTQDDFWNHLSDYDFYKSSPKQNQQPTPKPTTSPTKKPSMQNDSLVDGYNQADRSVITYLDDAKEIIHKYINSDDVTNFKSKAKSLVITVVDFLFYDGTIKGYTRKELTQKGKDYIMQYMADTLYELDYYFPGMSDSILSVYGKAKDTIKEKFSNIMGYVKDWMGEDYYDMFGDEFGELFDEFGDIGGLIGSLFDDKYQQWKLK